MGAPGEVSGIELEAHNYEMKAAARARRARLALPEDAPDAQCEAEETLRKKLRLPLSATDGDCQAARRRRVLRLPLAATDGDCGARERQGREHLQELFDHFGSGGVQVRSLQPVPLIVKLS
jgi:hypothetical protein